MDHAPSTIVAQLSSVVPAISDGKIYPGHLLSPSVLKLLTTPQFQVLPQIG